MQMRYSQLRNKSRTLRSLTGFNPSEFDALLTNFGAAWENFVTETFEQRTGRKRAYGAGRTAYLQQLADKLLFILFYFRQYPTQETQGFCLGRYSLAPRGLTLLRNEPSASERTESPLEWTAQSSLRR